MKTSIALVMLVCLAAHAADPIRNESTEPAKLTNTLADGGLPPGIGVRNIQVFRASRDVPEMTDGKGWTYNHHMDLANWKGRLYVGWNCCERDEGQAQPGRAAQEQIQPGVEQSDDEREDGRRADHAMRPPPITSSVS